MHRQASSPKTSSTVAAAAAEIVGGRSEVAVIVDDGRDGGVVGDARRLAGEVVVGDGGDLPAEGRPVCGVGEQGGGDGAHEGTVTG